MVTQLRAATATIERPALVHNDTHSRLNATTVRGHLTPKHTEDVVRAVQLARARDESMSVCGSCHAMGGQQFASDGWLLDMRGMKQILGFDAERGHIKVQAGITWPELIRHYVIAQHGSASQWGIRQKQTGADRLTVGGAVAANIHGRGLTCAPFVSDIESLEVVTADGSVVECDRDSNTELFRHVVGGYGLFGVVTSATIRLVPRQKVQRIVGLCDIAEIGEAFDRRIRSGYLYGDFQFSTAPEDRRFLSRGVFSCYRPVEPETIVPDHQVRLSPADWRRLIYLAHRNKLRAFNEFADFYLRSSGQMYWSDTHQLSLYLDDYHGRLDRVCDARVPGSEMITELYVPKDRLVAFMDDVRRDFLEHEVDLIYGTVRLIERDEETALPWAKASCACVIFNLHVDHDLKGIHRSASHFRRLIDIAIHHQGSFFLTYHRHATAEQLLACYPEFLRFLKAKRVFDPQETFQSDWYRHYRRELQGMK
ncbi:FAD/FMN-containing dehydrogenase [Povalibacter uvarum]|uniref:FAD/FMN-containing dehydrogenase n=1 Tax=Povalibacter uvarum TaxID=732238 RepID=A0A841HUN4_9GAMM|nr:FAD-binding oxidoreductase [Povalibacter uvarum]MBB6096364.1 FAD/FMN-containing dehydrogenase [Povalibacter uvarum]